MKVIELVTTHGSLWRIPALVVCTNRATYYKNRSDDYDVYRAEFEYCMDDDDEIIDWARNNMDWSDVRDVARLIETAEEDMSREWGAGDMEIIEQPSSSG